jgi:hypothetical protein
MKAVRLLILGGLAVGLGLFVASSILREIPKQTHTKKTHAEVAGEPDLKADANELKHTIVTPHLEQSIASGTNVLWCNTFQLAWNEFCDLTGGPIVMESPPPIVPILNKRAASKEDLDEASYVAMAGLASEGIYRKIRKELKEKFKGQASPDLLDATPEMAWVAYAYLFKELPFRWAFTRWHENLMFEGYRVDSFGIDQLLDIQRDEVRMASQVDILDHKNNDDLIIELKTQAEDDRLILAKIPPETTLAETISAVEKRIQEAKPTKMERMADLVVPVLNFDIFREYPELYHHPICTADKRIDGTSIVFAAQTVRFRLDERGAVLKSEGIMAGAKVERNLVFDKPFLILLKRREAKRPYFALWVGNAELLVPTQKKPMGR